LSITGYYPYCRAGAARNPQRLLAIAAVPGSPRDCMPLGPRPRNRCSVRVTRRAKRDRHPRRLGDLGRSRIVQRVPDSHYGSNLNASVCRGRAPAKWRRLRVAILSAPRYSAREVTDASPSSSARQAAWSRSARSAVATRGRYRRSVPSRVRTPRPAFHRLLPRRGPRLKRRRRRRPVGGAVRWAAAPPGYPLPVGRQSGRGGLPRLPVPRRRHHLDGP